MRINIIGILLVFMISWMASGCSQKSGYETYYNQMAPKQFSYNYDAMVFKYTNVDISEIYELLFSDYMIIGISSFNANYRYPDNKAEYFSRRIGADVLIASSQFSETRTRFDTRITPAISSSFISGFGGSGSYITATNYGVNTTTVPVQENRYDHDGFFLKNVNDVIPLWERTKDQYEKTSSNDIEGFWKNEKYMVEIFQSGDQMVAFVSEEFVRWPSWEEGELKFIFGVDSNVGVHLMNDKTPVPARFFIDRWGHLNIELLASTGVVMAYERTSQ